MASFHHLATAQLKQAVHIREQIESLQAKLDTLLGGAAPKAKVGRSKGARTVSAATKKKMAAAQQARWAKTKGAPVKAPANVAPKKRGTITPEGRAKLAAVMKARWAARKKGAPAPNAPAK